MARKTLALTLYASEIIYDVENKTYLTGRSRGNGSNHEEVANMQANEDDENRNQILRSIGNALGVLRTKMSEFIVGSATTANDALINGESNITITLTLPSNYNQATADSIAAAAHQYFVASATADWFTITNKADAADYVAVASASLEQLREAINKRVRPTRTTPA